MIESFGGHNREEELILVTPFVLEPVPVIIVISCPLFSYCCCCCSPPLNVNADVVVVDDDDDRYNCTIKCVLSTVIHFAVTESSSYSTAIDRRRKHSLIRTTTMDGGESVTNAVQFGSNKCG